jgi:transposase
LAAARVGGADYDGEKLREALAKLGQWTLDIVRPSDTAAGVEPLPRRRVVEHTIAWLHRNRRLAKAFEATVESAQRRTSTSAAVQRYTSRPGLTLLFPE